MKRRGLSAVVSTLIIVLLVLVAIATIWVVVGPMIEKGTSQIDITNKCLLVEVKPISGEYNTTSGIVEVRIKRTDSSADNPAGVKVIAYSQEGQINSTIYEGEIKPLDEIKVNINVKGDATIEKVSAIAFFEDNTGVKRYCEKERFYENIESVS